MHQISFNNITREFPETVSEMTPEQYRYFCQLELARQAGQISMARLEILFIYHVLNMVRVSNKPQVIENIHKLRSLVKPYFTSQRKDGKDRPVLDLDFVHNPIPEIKLGKTIYKGPGTALQDCEYAQLFVYAHNAYIDFSKTMQDKHLDRLVAALYMPAGSEFKAQDMISRAGKFKDIPLDLKFGVYLFFASCMKFIATNTALPIGGGVTVDISILFKSDGGSGSMKGIGAIGVIYDLAADGVFGDADKTGHQNAYDVLIRIIQLDQKAKKLKEDAKRNGAK